MTLTMTTPSAESPHPPPSPSRVTTAYRQNASLFLSESAARLRADFGDVAPPSPPPWAWAGDAARSLALRAVASSATVGADATDGGGEAGSDRKKRKKRGGGGELSAGDAFRALGPRWPDVACTTCGAFLFPVARPAGDDTGEGDPSDVPAASEWMASLRSPQSSLPGNVRLRPLKRGRTRRRRASRAKAKQLRERSLALRRRGGSNVDFQLRRDALAKEEARHVAYSHRMGDGRARNCLAITCNHCGTRKRRKGTEVRGDRKGGEESPRKHPPEARKVTANAAAAESKGDDSGFISLSPLRDRRKGGAKKDSVADAEKRVPGEALMSPLMGKKKKKKKPEAKKKGGLMDFLSSLND
ncbi:hypothetical protein ACHAWF_004358 [Thalassiosira exigua]